MIDSINAANALLDAYRRERKVLTAGIAKEMSTPLNVLHSRLQELVDGVIDKAEAARLLTQVDELSRIVDHLRTIADAEMRAITLIRQRMPDCAMS